MAQRRECTLVALEGADRVGKATQSRMLEAALTAAKLRATVEEIPYRDGLTHTEIYRFLREGSVYKCPEAFQTLQAINRRHFQLRYLPTLMQHFDVVILDRWNLSTRVYGAVDGVSEETTELLLRGLPEVALTVVLDADPWPKKNLDTLEANVEYQTRVRAKYREWCESDPKHYVMVDASRSRVDVHQDILQRIIPVLA